MADRSLPYWCPGIPPEGCPYCMITHDAHDVDVDLSMPDDSIDSEGEVLGCFILITDISCLTKVEQKLLAREHDLDRKNKGVAPSVPMESYSKGYLLLLFACWFAWLF
jgi:hypothetical protein